KDLPGTGAVPAFPGSATCDGRPKSSQLPVPRCNPRRCRLHGALWALVQLRDRKGCSQRRAPTFAAPVRAQGITDGLSQLQRHEDVERRGTQRPRGLPLRACPGGRGPREEAGGLRFQTITHRLLAFRRVLGTLFALDREILVVLAGKRARG